MVTFGKFAESAVSAEIMQICTICRRATFCKFAEIWSVRLDAKKNQIVIEIDLASQANSVLLEASQHTKRRLR